LERLLLELDRAALLAQFSSLQIGLEQAKRTARCAAGCGSNWHLAGGRDYSVSGPLLTCGIAARDPKA